MIFAGTLAATVGCGDDATNGTTANNGANNGVNNGNNGVNNGNNGANNALNNGANNGNNGANNGNNGANNGNNGNNGANNGGDADYAEGEADFPDCLTGCDHDDVFEPLVLNGDGPTTILGVLDGDDHLFFTDGGNVQAGDVDLVPFSAPPQSLVTIRVESVGGTFDPLLYTTDQFQILTFAGDESEDSLAARSQLIFPYLGLPVLMVVEATANYENFPGGPYVGGQDHVWRATVTHEAWSPIDLGTVGAQAVTEDGTIDAPGDMKVYKLTLDGGGSPEVTVTATGGLTPTVVPLRTNRGSAEYGSTECGEEGGARTVNFDALEIEGPDRYFLVYDCNGYGGEEFGYQLSVRVP